MRFTVVDPRGRVSFIAPCATLEALVAACASESQPQDRRAVPEGGRTVRGRSYRACAERPGRLRRAQLADELPLDSRRARLLSAAGSAGVSRRRSAHRGDQPVARCAPASWCSTCWPSASCSCRTRTRRSAARGGCGCCATTSRRTACIATSCPRTGRWSRRAPPRNVIGPCAMRFPDGLGGLLPDSASVTPSGHLALDGVDLVDAGGGVWHAAVRVRRGDDSRRGHAPTARAWPPRTRASRWCATRARRTARHGCCSVVADERLGLDVVSGGELYAAQRVGFAAERIYFHGNNKARATSWRRRWSTASAASSSTTWRRSSGWRGCARVGACGRRSCCGLRRASRRTRTRTSRPACSTPSSG